MKKTKRGNFQEPLLQLANKRASRTWIWAVSAATSFSFFALMLLVFRVIQPDLDEHIIISDGMWKNGKVPAHPVFYFLIQLFSFFSKDFTLELFAAFLIFSLAQTFKIISGVALVETISKKEISNWAFFGVLVTCWIITPGFFDEKFIINQIEPNFFHNGTLLVSAPFSIWMVRNMYLLAECDDFSKTKYILYSGIMAGLSKPSILFCVIPLFPFYAYMCRGISRNLLKALQISLLLSFLIIGQSLYLRINPPNYIDTFKIHFLPFYQYGSVYQHLKVVFFSLIIPLMIFIFGKGVFKNAFFSFLVACHALGLTIAFTLVDSINGIKFNNMTWQTSLTLLTILISMVGLFFQSGKISIIFKSIVTLFLNFCLGYFAWYAYQVIIYRSFFI